MDFKKITWQQWTAFGLIAALIVTLVVLHLVQPTISYALAECMCLVTAVVSSASTYLLVKKGVVKDTKTDTVE